MIRPHAVLLDMDGTLVDAFGPIVYALNRTLEEFGKPTMSEAAVKRHTGRGESSISALFGEQRQAAVERFLQFHDEKLFELTPLEGAESLLGYLQGASIPAAIVTSKSQSRAEQQIAFLGWDRYFCTIIGLSEGRRQKPDPHTLELACAALGTDPAGCLMIGDGTADMRAARSAGISAVGLCSHFSAEELIEAGAEHCFTSLREIETWLKQTD